ncbi:MULTISPECIES: GNAT family N-acetyltransferase [Rhizobium]|uniref:Ribosomal protein S18 acetylase RimI-like enzyme n=1 Tax=Rhizobium paranaense TaxID=1650438 RepID=A0A7W8XQA5_9HYPH|nr:MULTISPECIES: GNAT family N-acetyltransferase [Rhizobium]MBB5573610.1 ribosomal protein S18 acetylase RimI-like enzyme [Rhizobium paranaense]PST62783.1 GNAT family N-acetyltransferase [Rhizobium sp. SEMIA4064]
MDVNIRSALPEDAAAMANLHVTVWRETYRTLASPEAFRRLDEAHRQARWAATLAEPGRDQLVLLAEQGDRLVGIGAVGAPSYVFFEGRGEIRSLYIDPSLKRQGLGRRLMRELARHLADLHYPGAALGVVAGNEPAIAFYWSLGGRMAGRYIDPGPIWRSDNIIFVWDDLSLLI